MKILASGDNHFDEDSPRFEECVRVHAWMVDVADKESVDLFLCPGDIYERASTPRERGAVAEWLTAMAEVCPVVIAKGNHDRHLDCALLARLRTRCPIIVEEGARVHYVDGAAIAAMAWPERAAILAAVGSQGAADVLTREALQAVLRGLGDELARHDGPRILLGHFMVDGSVVSTGQPLLGQPINVGLADLALARAHLGVMGHIHMAQTFDVGGAPHFYTGSPYRTDFGQLEAKTVLLAELDANGVRDVRHLPTPCSRMVHLDAVWEGPDIAFCRNIPSGRFEEGSEIRLRYTTAPDQREKAREMAEQVRGVLLERGAVSVKVEEVVVTEKRARAPEVSRATDVRDKLVAHWESIGFEPGERREALLAKGGALQEEARDVA